MPLGASTATVGRVPEVLIINGPCGAGKSSVGFDCMEVLEERGIPAAMVDAELAYFHPQRGQGEDVAERALAAVWPVYRDEGIDRLLLPRVIEKPLHLDLVRRAVPDAQIQIAWLDVTPELNAERLRARERGAGLEWHLNRAEEIRRNAGNDFADIRVDGSRDLRAIALDLLARAGWV
jgi:hypothetical protein